MAKKMPAAGRPKRTPGAKVPPKTPGVTQGAGSMRDRAKTAEPAPKARGKLKA